MMSLSDLLAQNQPQFQTHPALLLIGLQNDFINPDGRLPVNTTSNAFLDRIHTLIPKFRQHSANVIWIQTIYEADRMANDPSTGEGDAVVVGGLVDGLVDSSTDDDDDLPKDHTVPAVSRSSKHKQRALDLLKRVSARRRTIPREEAQAAAEEDEELFLLRASKKGAACLPNTTGVDFVDYVKSSIQASDTVVRTSNYSAFQGTSLLLILRAKLVTELYICGCITNISVLATVIDAARHGIKIHVVEDCLGFRRQPRHDMALKRMVEFFDAYVVTSTEILNQEPSDEAKSQSWSSVENGSRQSMDALKDLVGKLTIAEDELGQQPPATSSKASSSRASIPAVIINGHGRTPSDVSKAESRATTDTNLSDNQFADILTRGAEVPADERGKDPPLKQNLVKSKIRMRTRSSKTDSKSNSKSKKEKEDKKTKGDEKKGESSSVPEAAAAEAVTATEPPAPRPPAITKAESGDKLREAPSRRQQSLKASVSQPALSSIGLESRERPLRSTPSRMRLALSRSSKSDSKVPAAQPPKSPAKTPAEKGKTTKLPSLANFPILGPGDTIAEGDSRIIYDFFPQHLKHPTNRTEPLKDLIFGQLYNEIQWQNMFHQTGQVPRLVCCQGEFGADGSMPVYRHPTDQALPLLKFSPKVRVIQRQAERLVGHPLNHVLIQLYRSGQDFISEHSDKTLDIVKGSSIVNVSLGAQRTMRLRAKKADKTEGSTEPAARETQRVAMPHNSMFVLGLKSNQRWLHGIQPDKRLQTERSEVEEAFGGARISLTFRNIGTFLDAEENKIWGQGATCKEQRDAQDVINDDESSNERVVRAFSRENHQVDFDWDACYGAGFDVLHFRNTPEDAPIFFGSMHKVENRIVQLFLAEAKINHIYLEAPALDKAFETERRVCYRDNDVNHTQVVDAVPIICYLNQYHALDRDDRGRACTAASYEVFAILSALLKAWNKRTDSSTSLADLTDMLDRLEDRQSQGPGPFIAGRRFSIGDCAVWPALDEIITTSGEWSQDRYPSLTEYYKMLWKKRRTVSKLRPEMPKIKKTAEVEQTKEGDVEAGLVEKLEKVVLEKGDDEEEG
ncbi:hypothetical protein K504DRAFT_386081 [Pleomassaria siparia CBS 279.74]|uniref:Fe2OG dioxygenase domain-containing protein n=1 Tax=Pleomassaria siparia CBS 279.74 TaxID=1314801 RepID=A0A6G1K0J1_9PLEO|nr:hypothetical protein K504DRAFT_386081 [Pleomassaria siparia CBS 279.74]